MEPPETLVIDANIVFGALSSRGFTFELIRFLSIHGLGLYSPQYIHEELEEKTERLLKYSGLSGEDLNLVIRVLFKHIRVVPKSQYGRFLPEAELLIVEHPEDIPYLALSIALNCPLWSNERRLREQSKVKILPTHELKKLFGID